MENRQRLDYIDIAKGIGIILVVAGHALSAISYKETAGIDLLRTIIYLVHMPLFFFIAGILFEKNINKYESAGTLDFMLKKARLYLIPYVTFSVLLYAVTAAALHIKPLSGYASKLGSFTPDIPAFLGSIVTYVKPIDEHLWFSYVMFLVLALSFLLRKPDVRIIMCVFAAGYVSTWFVSYPELIWKVLRYMLIFTAGRAFRKYDIRPSKKTLLYSLAAGIAGTVIYLILKDRDIAWMSVMKPVAEIGCVIALLCISSAAAGTRVSDKLKYAGNESYAIYLIHQPYIVPLTVAILGGTPARDALAVTVSIILGIVIPILLSRYVIQKNKVLNLLMLGGH